MMPSLVIAHVLSSFDLGGQERMAVELARRQRTAGHGVVAVSLAPGPEGVIAEAFRDGDVRVATVAKRGRLDPTLPFRLAAVLRRHDVTVVHTHNPHALIYGAPAARLMGAVAIHSKHGMNPDTGRRIWLRRAAARLADAYVAVTPALAAAALANDECNTGRLHVISNGIDVTRFASSRDARSRVRAELGVPDGAWVVGTVGRLAPEKNQALLIDAMAPLLDERRRLVIVGDGPLRESLLAQLAGVPSGRFASMTGARSDVEDLLGAFDAFALTSRTEGLPLVLLEAMATGLPVVSTAVGGIPDLIEHQVTGFLTKPGEAGALTQRLSWLSTNSLHSRQVGTAARNDVMARYSAERMAAAYGAVYADALAKRRGRGARARSDTLASS